MQLLISRKKNEVLITVENNNGLLLVTKTYLHLYIRSTESQIRI